MIRWVNTTTLPAWFGDATPNDHPSTDDEFVFRPSMTRIPFCGRP